MTTPADTFKVPITMTDWVEYRIAEQWHPRRRTKEAQREQDALIRAHANLLRAFAEVYDIEASIGRPPDYEPSGDFDLRRATRIVGSLMDDVSDVLDNWTRPDEWED